VHRHVLVSLLEAVILLDVVQVIPSDDAGPVHLELGDDARQDAAANADVAGEGALLVDVVSLTSLNMGRKRTTLAANSRKRQSKESCKRATALLPVSTSNVSSLIVVTHLSGDLESQAGVLHPSRLALLESSLLGQEDVGLLLEGPLRLEGGATRERKRKRG